METMMQSAVCLLEQAAEKFKNKTVLKIRTEVFLLRN